VQGCKTSIIPYPEDFLTMKFIGPSTDDNNDIMLIYSTGQNANGPFRIAYYQNYNTVEMQYPTGKWEIIEKVYKNANYATSEGISVGSSKKDVVKAYKKYGLQEYKIGKITHINVRSLDILLGDVTFADTFLYVDNHNAFSDSYPGVNYWNGSGAFIFIINTGNVVERILSYSPTAG